ncbi:ABC-2 type transport system ATP-binding protein [Aeromicrobium panaciterrae]|uniref:ABC-2 type transport system ATP-binding protein n=1 Tax=Aeromicrobium panaciterrae TaxID=363861 RepID=A0ABU1UJ92_9ACTN|nr:CocE/NonD family hydrolase [Aeromicrobium panaciterrae]MDR7085257.1 ABC-2 type transport system ATP-binding protein [Aeromicrobium panaciterrae]
MRSARPYLLALLGVGLAASALVQPAQAADPTYTVQTLHFAVNTGADNSVPCKIIGDLYLPKSATATKKVPAILTTNGFGGSKDDQAGVGRTFAARGYAVLSYSGLGFGGSGCKITLDDPDTDGKAASQLVSYLGGKTGIAFTDADHKVAAPALKVVKRDSTDHTGKKSTNDPRVGMVGGSYGGQIQFAAAGVDPRIDTIIPIITWSDLSYSLSPNNTSQTSGVQTSTPGAAKLVWALGFTGLGIVNGLQNAQVDPSRLIPCPNYATFVCPAVATAGLLGTVDASTTKDLRHASVSSYFKKITVPTLIIQGQSDTLFNINEGVANYKALQKQGTPTKMIWFNGGHSGPAAPGELNIGNPNPATEHLSKNIANWFDHYLKGKDVSTGPEFSYFRDWVKYTGIATPAYGTASSYPVGTATKYYLSGTQLTKSSTGITAGTQSFITPPAGLPTSTDPTDVVAAPLPELDLPGTSASWSTPTLTKATNVVGQPKLTVKVSAQLAEATQAAGPYGSLVLFVKIADVDAAGKATIIRNLVAPVRVPDASKPFTVTLPGFAHQFAKGHTLKLIVAGGSTNYRGGLIPNAVTITTGTTGQVLTLPIVN